MADPIFNKVAEFMTDTVVFSAQLAGTAGRDKYNKRTFAGTAASTALRRTVSGRLIFDTILRKDAEGREIVEIGRFITLGPPTPEIMLSDQMVFSGRTAIIQAVDPISDENGAHHTVVKFGF